MSTKFVLPQLAGVLLLASASLAAAESPLPDPIAPAVLGRPVEQIRPARPARPAPVAKAANKPRPVAAAPRAAVSRASAVAAVAPAAVPQRAAVRQVVQQPRVQRAIGAYFTDSEQALVRRYYESNPVPAHAPRWKAGETVPEKARMTGVPDDVRAGLPVLPRGLQYVQLDGEVVLVAVESRLVVDGVSRAMR